MIYAFGEYALDTQRYELRCAGELLKIEPQVFNVLAYLMQHRDRTVTRQELLEQLWPEQFISDAVLSYRMMTARKAIGDSGRTQRIIATSGAYARTASSGQGVYDLPDQPMRRLTEAFSLPSHVAWT
jgi:DNA-binding winged helix-turn-helix (wHTH) protein